jgi:signal transduction histidine kinase
MRFSVNWRFVRNAAAICLPTACAIALGISFLVIQVPRIEKNERARVRAEYREVALNIRQDPKKFAEILEKGDLKATGKMAPGKWGYLPSNAAGQVRVWYDDGTVARYVEVPVVEEAPEGFIFTTFVIFFIFVIVLLTFFGVRFFIRYARERDEFVAATVHDLTTPLVGMRMAVGKNDDDALALVTRMISLVENLKSFLLLGGRRAAPKVEKVDVLLSCREAYSPFRDDFRDFYDGADVGISFDGESAIAVADKTLVVQVLWNLFANALKYAAPHGKVEVKIRETPSSIKVSFLDEGPGMSGRDRKKVFNRYYRARSIASSGKGGFGIGLCIAREFARSMGGDVTVSQNGKGSAFTMELPK